MSWWQKIRNLFVLDVTRNLAKILSSNLVAQLIAFAVYPILTRMYAPSDFGLLNLFWSIGGVLALCCTAEYQYSIILPRTDRQAAACLHVGGFCTLSIFVILLCSIPFSEQIAAIFKAPELARWYVFLPFFVLFSAIWTLLNYWFLRIKEFNGISTYQLSRGVITSSFKCGFGYAGFLQGGLIISTVIAPALSVAVAISRNCKAKLGLLFSFSKTDCKAVAKEYANFPKFSLPRALVNYFSGNIPIFLLTPFFGLEAIGFFGTALTLAFLPINMVSTSFNQVLFQHTAERVRSGESIRHIVRKFLKTTAVFVIPLFAMLYVVLPDLVAFILGDGWKIVGEYIQIMLVWLVLSLVGASINYLVDVFQKQKISLCFELLSVFSRIIGIAVGIWMNDFRIAVIGFCAGASVIIAGQIVWYISLVSCYEKTRTI